jgi:hypothetical protein
MDKSTDLSLLFFNLILKFYDPSSDFFFLFFDVLKFFLSLSLFFQLSKEQIIVLRNLFLTFLYCLWSNI